MNYIGISDFDTANGPGVRVSLFVSGCRLRCRGCFNPESWDFDAGKPYDESVQERILKALEEDYVDGLSLLGGDPLEPENVEVLTDLCRAVREKFGNKKTIWLWTGRLYDKVKDLEIFSTLTPLSTVPSSRSTRSKEKATGLGAPISA